MKSTSQNPRGGGDVHTMMSERVSTETGTVMVKAVVVAASASTEMASRARSSGEVVQVAFAVPEGQENRCRKQSMHSKELAGQGQMLQLSGIPCGNTLPFHMDNALLADSSNADDVAVSSSAAESTPAAISLLLLRLLLYWMLLLLLLLLLLRLFLLLLLLLLLLLRLVGLSSALIATSTSMTFPFLLSSANRTAFPISTSALGIANQRCSKR